MMRASESSLPARIQAVIISETMGDCVSTLASGLPLGETIFVVYGSFTVRRDPSGENCRCGGTRRPGRQDRRGTPLTLDLLHDGRDIPLEGLVNARKEGQTVFLDLLEIFWRVDASLV